ncbi:NineTeen Complex (NTC) component [Pichia californica]|nr:NineTeen Complex (NTC) component [[Candida] californica]
MSGVKRKATEDLENDENDEKKQFTASRILKSAYESSINELKTPDVKIADLDELHYFQQRKRTEYENALRRNRFNYGQWMRYAQFEIDQKDQRRARSIFERALEVDYKNVSMWIRYIQTEIKNKNINHARNLLERVTGLLPRIDKLWYMYITIEESIGNIVAVNEIFENWLQWKPIKDVWIHFLEFKERYEEYESERLLFEKFVTSFCDSDSWLRWVEFEKKHGDYINVENVFKLGVNAIFTKGKLDSKFLISWIRYEHSNHKFDKVKELYDFGFKALNNDDIKNLQKFQTNFEKQYGVDTHNVEKYVLLKRKIVYEEKLNQNQSDYETWWIYFNLIIDSNIGIREDEIRKHFEIATNIIPKILEITKWIPYFYICYRYALWEEFDNREVTNAKNIYEKLLKIIPFKKLNIIQFWYKYADFQIRNYDINSMRKVLGQAIGLTSSPDIIMYYIKFEIKLRYFDRARKLYNKLIELYPENWNNWLDYFNFEDSLGNDIRSYNIIEIVIFENFINKEDKILFIESVVDRVIENYNFKLARRLYEYQLELTDDDIDAVIDRCLFELKVPSEDQIKAFENNEEEKEKEESDYDDENITFNIHESTKDNVRAQYEKFIKEMKENDNTQNRIILLESLEKFEEEYGDENKVKTVKARLPRISRKVREDTDGIQEEYIEYIFPEDEKEIEDQVADFKSEFLEEFEAVEEDEEGEGGDEDDEVEESENDTGKFTKSFHSRFASDSEEDDDEKEDGDDDEEQLPPQKKTFRSRFEE